MLSLFYITNTFEYYSAKNTVFNFERILFKRTCVFWIRTTLCANEVFLNSKGFQTYLLNQTYSMRWVVIEGIRNIKKHSNILKTTFYLMRANNEYKLTNVQMKEWFKLSSFVACWSLKLKSVDEWQLLFLLFFIWT